jgi:hypothetical protein
VNRDVRDSAILLQSNLRGIDAVLDTGGEGIQSHKHRKAGPKREWRRGWRKGFCKGACGMAVLDVIINHTKTFSCTTVLLSGWLPDVQLKGTRRIVQDLNTKSDGLYL